MMRLLLAMLLALQEGPAIVFPSGPVVQDAQPVPATVDAIRTDEWYLIESDVALIVLDSPAGLVQVKQAKQGAVLLGKFAGVKGITERTIDRPFGYLVRGMAGGEVELLVFPAGGSDPADLRRRRLTVQAVVDPDLPGPVRPLPTDPVSVAFRAYEQEWRTAQGELAERLDSGMLASESAAAEWFGAANLEARKRAFTPVLRLEAEAFGGDAWTAKKHAEYVRRYVRQVTP